MKNEMDPLSRMKEDAKVANRRLRKKWGMVVDSRPELEVLSKTAERVDKMIKRGNTRAQISGYLNISLSHVGRIIREYGLPRSE